MSTSLSIQPEVTRADRRAFLDVPYRLYRGHPVWVPPVRRADAALLDRRKNAFFAHGDAQHFLARRGGRVVGRIAAIENRRHNEVHGDRLGFFGWFDCEADVEAAAALVRAAHDWTRGRGLVGLRGPVNYSTNDVCGVLVEGFDDPPAILMPYNRPDYGALLEGAGLVKAKDLLACWVATVDPPPERYERTCARALKRYGVTLRQIDVGRFREEARVVKQLYNRCWADNWGFVPATDAEFDQLAKDMKFVVDPRLFLIAERGGEPVGFLGAVVDINQTLHGLAGRLFPFGMLRILWRKRRISRWRLLTIGVVPEQRGRGIDAALILHAFRASRAAGYLGCEGGWILESNERMKADVKSIGGSLSKRYRLYETPAGAGPAGALVADLRADGRPAAPCPPEPGVPRAGAESRRPEHAPDGEPAPFAA